MNYDKAKEVVASIIEGMKDCRQGKCSENDVLVGGIRSIMAESIKTNQMPVHEIAAFAMQAILSATTTMQDGIPADKVAELAYQNAEAMMKQGIRVEGVSCLLPILDESAKESELALLSSKKSDSEYHRGIAEGLKRSLRIMGSLASK